MNVNTPDAVLGAILI